MRPLRKYGHARFRCSGLSSHSHQWRRCLPDEASLTSTKPYTLRLLTRGHVNSSRSPRTMHLQAPNDFVRRTTKIARPLLGSKWIRIGLPFIPLLALLAGLLILVTFTLNTFNPAPNSPFGCDPNGQFWVADGVNDSGYPRAFWPSKYALSVSLSIADMQFSTAKTLDILWDLAIGRGSQAVGAMVVYYVFRKAILIRGEQEVVPLGTVISVQYETTSVPALVSYSKAAAWLPRRFRPSWPMLTLASLISSSIYVLALPTWLSAMTAYQSINNPMIRNGATLFPPTDLQQCIWYISDGHRIGLEEVCITYKYPEQLDYSLRICAFYL